MDQRTKSYEGEIHIEEGVYPLNWKSGVAENPNPVSTQTPATSGDDEEDIYPDFSVWKPTDVDNEIMKTFLQKGYIAPPLVRHEDQSGRPLMTDLISKTAEISSVSQNKINKLCLMSQVFVDAMHKRRVFNGIKSSAPFKPPPRVTLTEQKKEIWLKRLSDPRISLNELSRSIPHGLRNKTLLEQCLSHRVFISRALWLIKCVASNEQRQLRRKNSYSSNINKWIIEWTEQVTSFFEATIISCVNGTLDKEVWRQRLNYTIELVTNMYSFELLNRLSFLTWIVNFTSHNLSSASCFEDLKHLIIHCNIIKLFWFKILKYDYLTKELSVSLLMILEKLEKLGKNTKFESLAKKLTRSFQTLIKFLFYYNSDTFILPSNWSNLKTWLQKSLDLNLAPVNDQFNLISYRNETLTIDEFDLSPDNNSSVSPSPSPTTDLNNLEVFQSDNLMKLRRPKNRICLILSKLNNSEKETFLTLSKLIFDDSCGYDTRYILHQIFLWCTEKVRCQRVINQRIMLVSSILQFKLSQLINQNLSKYKQFRAELENSIGDFVYKMAEILNYKNKINYKGEFYDVNNFLYLINILFSIKLFIVSSYLRRLIASGVIYLADPDRTCYIHILILTSLPPSNDSNIKSIFKRLLDSTNLAVESHTMESYKQREIFLIDNAFETQEISLDFDNDIFQSNKHIDPLYVGEYLEVERFIISYFENKLLTTTAPLFLTYNKLLLFYYLFERYPDGLCRYIVSIIDTLNHISPTISLNNSRTLSLLVKFVFFNMNYLKNSIYNLESNMWDHCVNVFTSWNSTNRYDFKKAILMTNTSKIALFFNFDTMMKDDPPFLTPEELISLDLSSYERLTNRAEFYHHATLALTKYRTYLRDSEIPQLNLMSKFLRSLQVWKVDDFNKCLCDYLNRFFKSTFQLEYESNLNLIIQMLADELLDFKKVMEIFGHKSGTKQDILSSENHLYLLWDLFFNDNSHLSCSLKFQVQFAKHIYIESHPEEYYRILSEILFNCFKCHNVLKEEVNRVVGSVDVVNVPGDSVITDFPELGAVSNLDTTSLDEPMKDFVKIRDDILNESIIDSFWNLSLQHPALFINLFYMPFEKAETLDFTSLLLFVFQKVLNQHVDFDEISEIEVFSNLNYSNLPIAQWMFKYVVSGRYKEFLGDVNRANEFFYLVERMLSINFDDENILFLTGELFVYLSDSFKSKFLSACEQVYLNSENFPKVIVNSKNVTNVLSSIISSCSKMSDNSLHIGAATDECEELDTLERKAKLKMNDALVFSLNGRLENLIHICNQLEQDKRKLGVKKIHITEDLELGIKMISRIVLLHRYFLVQLIIKRSVNLQRDVLILNLLKLFNHKIMMRDPKLKNLLYDVLMSLKVIISEYITERFKRNQLSGGTATQVGNVNLMNKETPTSSTFLSPVDSPLGAQLDEEQKKKNKPKIKNDYIIMPNILNIKPPSFNSNLKSLLDMFDFQDTIPEIKDGNLYVVNEKWDDTVPYEEPMIKFISKPFEQIEDASPAHASNDTAINLQLFKMSVKKENPP